MGVAKSHIGLASSVGRRKASLWIPGTDELIAGQTTQWTADERGSLIHAIAEVVR